MVQFANGSIDAIGFTGKFSDASLNFTNSFLVPGSVGSAPVQAVNQGWTDSTFHPDESLPGGLGAGGVSLEGVQFVEQLANGTFDSVFSDSGYGDPTHQGTIYGSNILNNPMPGWHAVDAGGIARELFPVT
jgi:hypothetical protein